MILARQYDEALAHWRGVQAADPENREASRMSAALIIQRSRQRAGLPPSAALELNPRTVLPEMPSPPAGGGAADFPPESATGLRLTRTQQLETAIKDQAANADVYLELAQLYLDKGREYEAERLLTRAREDTGRDPRVLWMSEDVTMLRLEKKVFAAERDVELDDTQQTRAALEQMHKERDRVEIEIFQERSRRDPDNLAIRYELGRRLARAGKAAQARPYLEEALQHEASRCNAALALGQLLLASGQAPEAQRHFRIAAAAAAQTGQPQCQAQALLQAAQVASRGQMLRLARRYVAELLKLDPHHAAGIALLEALERKAG